MISRKAALQYVGFALDDSLNVRTGEPIPEHARLVGFQCGFDPLFVAVWSYLGVKLDDCDAEEIAVDYLLEKQWTTNPDLQANYIL